MPKQRIKQTKLELYTDNKAAIRKLKMRQKVKRTVNQHKDADYDIEQQILKEIEQIEGKDIKVTLNYVKSYGCNTKKKDLSLIEKIHCQADGFVKQARLLPRQHHYHHLPNNNVTFTMNDETINANYTKITAVEFHNIRLRQYLSQKYGWKSPTISSIWWRMHHQALTTWTIAEQLTIQKFNNDCWATNYKNNKYYQYKPAHFYCCKETSEREDHIIQCSAENGSK
jgi:hypothetical protein